MSPRGRPSSLLPLEEGKRTEKPDEEWTGWRESARERERQRGENSEEEEKHEKSREHRGRRNPERGSVIRSSLLSLAVVAGQCCRARGRGRPLPRGVLLYSVISRGCKGTRRVPSTSPPCEKSALAGAHRAAAAAVTAGDPDDA